MGSLYQGNLSVDYSPHQLSKLQGTKIDTYIPVSCFAFLVRLL